MARMFRAVSAPLVFSARRFSPRSFDWSSGAVSSLGKIRQKSSNVSYHCVHVFIKVKSGTEDAFMQASLKNARSSAKEEGVARFDVLQDKNDPLQFVFVEVYKNDVEAPLAHKETSHYLEWRDTVADMMAEPRTARKFENLFPKTAIGWDYAVAVKSGE